MVPTIAFVLTRREEFLENNNMVPIVYCRKHVTAEYIMVVIVSILPHEAKAVVFCLQLNTIGESGHRTSTTCRDMGLRFTVKG